MVLIHFIAIKKINLITCYLGSRYESKIVFFFLKVQKKKRKKFLSFKGNEWITEW